MAAAPEGVRGTLWRRSWERWRGQRTLPKVRAWWLLLREVAQRNAVLHEEWASQRPGTAAPAEGPVAGPVQPQQTAGETGAQALLFGLGSGPWRGQTAMLSCRHPLVTSWKGLAGDPPSRGSSVFSLLRVKALPQGSGLAGFTSWPLTMDSGPWGGIKKGMFQTEPRG